MLQHFGMKKNSGQGEEFIYCIQSQFYFLKFQVLFTADCLSFMEILMNFSKRCTGTWGFFLQFLVVYSCCKFLSCFLVNIVYEILYIKFLSVFALFYSNFILFFVNLLYPLNENGLTSLSLEYHTVFLLKF